jgi:FtsP/CotA-like multicopper oxidase with cupredoxin domain
MPGGDTLTTCFDARLVATGPQRYLIHCHKLQHEDAGTMSAFRRHLTFDPTTAP